MFRSTVGILQISIFLLVVSSIDSFETIDDLKTNELKEYVLLVSDVQEYFKASSVIIICDGGDENILTTTLMARLMHEFSSKFVLSQTLNYTDVIHRDYYRTRILRPLFVTFLSTASEVSTFQNVTANFDMSYPFWLIIFTQPFLRICYEPSDRNHFNIAFDTEMIVKCHGDSALREWYSLNEKSTRIYDLADWDIDYRLKLRTTKPIYKRRNTLGGKILRIAIAKESPYTADTRNLSSSLFTSILNELSSALDFSTTTAYEEENYGLYNESVGEWSGIFRRIHKKEADIGVAELTMTAQRLDAVDFTLPIMLSRSQLYMKRPLGSTLQWSAYFRVYTISTWLAMQGMHVLSWLVITYIRVLINEKPIPPNHISENGLFIWGIFCLQSLPEFPIASSMRIAYFTILVSAVIFLAVYSACLISYLTLTSPSLPFTNLDEFAKDATYKLIAFKESTDYHLFSKSKDVVLQKMMKLMLNEKHLPNTMMAGFKQACNDKIAFFVTEAVKTRVNAQIPCTLVALQSGRIDSLGMILTKRSQYTGIINYHLQKFRDVGIMNRLRSIAYTKVVPTDNKYHPVDVNNIVTILLILVIGVLLSVIILIFEIFIHRVRKVSNIKTDNYDNNNNDHNYVGGNGLVSRVWS